ncbi:MAG: aldo/keto reductase [Spirochaetaceae bacterium]|nr:MAG: aldo/keto reductase [Spirochaetaceae bacterium]
MSSTKTIRLGKSGLQVTRIGFGGIPIQRLNQQQSIRVLQRALEGGLNWIDTAYDYGNSEDRVGKAIKKYSRSDVLVFTKGTGRDPKTLREQIELSLLRLQTEYIDLYQFHLVSDREKWQTMQDNGTFDLLREYRDKGKIRHIGASAHTREAALAVIEHPEIEVLQYPFNFIVEEEGLELIGAARKRDIGFIAMKPFGGGALEDASACIRFLLSVPDIVTDPGFEHIEEVDEVLYLWKEGAPLSTDNHRTIERLRKSLGTRFCRRCGYCSPCPHGVQIITLMTMENLMQRFPVDRLSEEWIAGAGTSVENCIECGECEEKCPYKLPIIEEIRRGADTLARALQPIN